MATVTVGHFSAAVVHAHHIQPRGKCGAILFSGFEENTLFCKFPFTPLTIPPSKVYPKYKAIVHIWQKLCNSCKHMFRGKRIAEQAVNRQKLHRKCKASVRAAETSKLCIDLNKAESTKQV